MSEEYDAAEVDLRLAMLRHWHGDMLTEAQWREVREGVREEIIEISRALQAVPLDYEDEPLPLFTPYREDA